VAIGLALVPLACFLYLYCSNPFVRILLGGRYSPDMAEVLQRAGIALPSSARLLGSDLVEGPSDWELKAKIEVSREEADPLVARLRKALWVGGVTLASEAKTRDPRNEWWDPGSARRVVCLEGRLDPKQGHWLWALVDLDDPDRAIVYLLCVQP
jgi:hypothetical protein